jgi:hypothetical protein
MPDADDVNTVSVRCFHNGEREPAISDSLQPSLISEMTWSRTKSMPTKLPDVLGLPIEVELKSRHSGETQKIAPDQVIPTLTALLQTAS